MQTADISSVTQEEFDSAAQLIIAGLKSSDPKLDTRIGTVLRSLLVNPEARIEASVTKQIEYVRKATSLKALKESEESGEEIDTDDVNAVLSNFGVTSSNGTYAEGLVKIVVSDGDQEYHVHEGDVFETYDGLRYAATSSVTAAIPGNKSASDVNATLYAGYGGFFFIVPVMAEQVGADYNIIQGTGMKPATSLYTFVEAGAYKSFSGGSDIADLEETIAKIPSRLSIRGFVNRTACEGMLRDTFDSGKYPILACSTVGYGNAAQRRDKHNAFGVGVGGRIDLYVRNFGDLFTITKTVKGKRIPVEEDGRVVRMDYELDVLPSDFPGSYWVKEISSTNEVNSSLEFRCSRTCVGIDGTWHDFDVSKNSSEAFNTVWHGLHVVAEEVPPDGDDSSSSEEAWSDNRDFSVTVYCLPQANDLQSYVDRDDIRSVSTDVVIRCPVICNVTVSANVVYDTKNPMSEEDAKYKIRKYINSLGFVKSLTRSEIVHILKSCGAVSVNLGKKDMLFGTIYDAYGKEYNISGDALQLDGLASDDAMLSSQTAVFAAEPENIQLTLTPNE